MWPLVVTNTDAHKTIAVGIASYRPVQTTYVDYGVILAAATVAILPVVIVYLILQKRIIQGSILSGMKALTKRTRGRHQNRDHGRR